MKKTTNWGYPRLCLCFVFAFVTIGCATTGKTITATPKDDSTASSMFIVLLEESPLPAFNDVITNAGLPVTVKDIRSVNLLNGSAATIIKINTGEGFVMSKLIQKFNEDGLQYRILKTEE